MNYEQKYKEALDRAKGQLEGAKVFDYNNEQIAHDIRSTVYNIFSELKESEDERIRKEIIELLKNYASMHYITKEQYKERMDWLEKQGEQKPSWSEEDEISFLNTLWCCKKVASIAKDENEMGTVWYAERWLKSLKNRCTWKPTEKQINAIRLARSFVTDDFSDNPTLSERLLELEKQLKKRMEE